MQACPKILEAAGLQYLWARIGVSRSNMTVRTGPVSTVPGYVVYHQTRDLSGQSTPHMIRSRATHHVIQSATLATFQVRSKCM